jgi:predicted dehydrogenase
MAAKKLKGVCIGAGYFSHFQYDAWRRLSEVELTAFAEHDDAKAKVTQEKFGVPRVYRDYREMLETEQPDFVDVITPSETHLEICGEAARRGIHILCQKPLANNLTEARQIVQEAQASGARFMVNENFRFQPWHRKIKQLIEEGAIGVTVHSLHFRMRTGDGWGARAYLPRQPYFRNLPRLLIYETGVHFIDTYRYLAGEIVRVSAWLRKLNPIVQGEDCGLLVLEFASGAIGQWDANRYNESLPGVDPRYTFGEFLVEGSEGCVRLDMNGGLSVQRLGSAAQEVEYAHERRGFAGDCCFLTQRHFVDRLLDGKPFETSGEEYLKTLVVQEAVYASAAQGAPVRIPHE